MSFGLLPVTEFSHVQDGPEFESRTDLRKISVDMLLRST